MNERERFNEIVAFLCGEAALDGRRFCEAGEQASGAFWWRRYVRRLQQIANDSAAREDELVAEVERLQKLVPDAFREGMVAGNRAGGGAILSDIQEEEWTASDAHADLSDHPEQGKPKHVCNLMGFDDMRDSCPACREKDSSNE